MRKSIVVIIVVMLALSALDIISQGISERNKTLLSCDKSPDEPPVTSGKRILLKQEIVYWQDDPDHPGDYNEIMRDQDGSEVWLGCATDYPYIYDAGDWNGDGKDDILSIYDQPPDQSNLFIWITDGDLVAWPEQPYIYKAAFGDLDGDSIKLEYLGEWTDAVTDLHPIALLYKPPYKEDINSGEDCWTEYATGTTEGCNWENMLGITAYCTYSFNEEIPTLLKAKVQLTVKNEMEVAHGYSTEITKITGYRTGNKKTHYVVAERTMYRQYKYKVINGPDDGKIFSINVPIDVSISLYELDYYNTHCSPEYRIEPVHTVGDPTTYTKEFPHDDELETDLSDITQGGLHLYIDIEEKELESYKLTEGVDFTSGLEITGFAFEMTVGVYTSFTHSLITGKKTIFESWCPGIPSEYYDEYHYSYKMYIRRDPDHKFTIIDFWVDPDSLGPGYGYNPPSPPEFKCKIVKPKNAIYLFDKYLFSFIVPIIIGEITVEVEASSGKGIDKVEFYLDNELKATDDKKPYEWQWVIEEHGIYTIKVVAYDKEGNKKVDKKTAFCISLI